MMNSSVRLARSGAGFLAAAAVMALLSLPGCKGGGNEGNAPSGTAGGSATSTSGSSTGSSGGSTIAIGEYGSLTGNTATFGTSTYNGIKLAVQKLNSAHGVLGKQLEVIVKDDNSDAAKARTAVEALVNQKVAAVLGEVASSRSLQGAPVCQQAQVPMITPSSTNPRVTQVGDYIFRVCFIDEFQGKAIADTATDMLHANRAAMLYDNGQDYSKGLREFIEQRFKSRGGTILSDFTYSSGDSDFRSQLTAIKGLNPQVIFVPGYYTEVGKIASQARQLGITAPLIGGDGWDSPELTKVAGSALNGCYFTNHFSPDEKSTVVQAFVKEYQAAYHTPPDAMAALGYDAAGVLADSIKRAGSTDEPALRNAIAATKNYQGVTGTISINADRNAVKPIVVVKIVNGAFTFAGRINPS